MRKETPAEYAARHRAEAASSRPVRVAAIVADLRAELDQTPAWWDRQYEVLVRRCFPPKPFDLAEHIGHEVMTIDTFDGSAVRGWCADCREG